MARMRMVGIAAIWTICWATCSGCAALTDLATGRARAAVDADLHREYGVRPDDSALQKLVAVVRREQERVAAARAEGARLEAGLRAELEAARTAGAGARSEAERAAAVARIAELEGRIASARAEGEAQVADAADQRNGGIAAVALAALLGGLQLWRRGATLRQIVEGQGRAVKQYLEGGGTADLLGLFERHLGPKLEPAAKAVLAKAGVGVRRPRAPAVPPA